IASKSNMCIQIDTDAIDGCRIIGSVVAAHAINPIWPRQPGNNVVVIVPGKKITSTVIRPYEILDTNQEITMSVAAKAGGGIQIDANAISGSRIVGRIRTTASLQQVRASKARDQIVVGSSLDPVVGVIAGQEIAS